MLPLRFLAGSDVAHSHLFVVFVPPFRLDQSGLRRQDGNGNDRGENLSFIFLGDVCDFFGSFVKIDGLLDIQPKLRSRTKGGSQLYGHLRCHGGSAIDKAVDDLDIAADMIGQLLLSHSQGLQEFFA